MRTLGLLFIGLGLLLCMTFFLAPWGFGAIIAGALLYMADRTPPLRLEDMATRPRRGVAAVCLIAIAVILLGAWFWNAPVPVAKPPAAQMSSEWQKAFPTPPPPAKPVKASRGR